MPDRAPGFRQSTAIDCEVGAVERLADHAYRLGIRKPLLLIDTTLVDGPVGERIRSLLPTADLHRLQPGEPSEESVAQAAKVLVASDCDGVIAVGGGSTLDTAKVSRGMLAAETITLPLPAPLPRAPLPLVTVPTTAGTGAELGAGAVIYDPKVDTKSLVKIASLAADVAVCDGDLTLGLPASLTAYTGLDALAQAILAYVAAGPESVAGQNALVAVRLIHRALPEAVARGSDRAVRGRMMLGSVMSALAMFNAPPTYGGEHLFAEPLGAALGIHHGHTVAALLPGTIDLYLGVLARRFGELGTALGVTGGSQDQEHAAAAFAVEVRRLVRSLGVAGLGTRTTVDAAEAAAALATKVDLDAGPRPVTEAELTALLRGGFSGSFALEPA